jgi:hypothetical protein
VVSLAPLAALARSPRAGVDVVLAQGSALLAFLLMVLASIAATLVASRVGAESNSNALFFAETRQPLVQVLIDGLGTQRAAVVLYLVQRSFDAVIFAGAFSPIFFWLLGSSAIHASARLAGIRRPYRPLLVLFAYATALTLVPANAAALVLGVGQDLPSRIAGIIGYVCLAWLGVIAFRAIQAHYGVDGDRAARILIVAVVLFYLIPLALIVLAAVAIIIAALVLNYF